MTSHATLFLLHDGDLLRTEALCVHARAKALPTAWSRRRLELTLRVGRLASKPTLAAEGWSRGRLGCVSTGTTARHTTHHSHELVHVHLARVHALRHHLHHLVHPRHTGWCGSGHSWHPSTRVSAHAEHGFHLHVLIFLLSDRASHTLLAYAILCPGVLVKAVVEEIGLVGSRQAPELGVLGKVGIDVKECYGFVDARPAGIGTEIDGACADLRKVFALFTAVGRRAFDRGGCGGSMLGFRDF